MEWAVRLQALAQTS
nr:hypothetical protein [Streptococcus ruminantium]